MACQWTDEQTGGHCPTLAGAFTGTDHKWFTFTNGVHTDSLDPETFNRWYDFMTLYVAQRKPELNPAQKARGAGRLRDRARASTGSPCPTTRSSTSPTTPRPSRRSSGSPQVRILFDNGAGSAVARQPRARASSSRSTSGRSPGTQARSLLPRRRRRAGLDKRPEHGGKDKFNGHPAARPPTDFTGNTGSGTNGLWTATPAVRLGAEPGRARAASYVSAPLSANTTVIGGGALQGLGALGGRSASTCRRPSPRSAPTARRPSCRAAGCAATCAQARPGEVAPSSSRC